MHESFSCEDGPPRRGLGQRPTHSLERRDLDVRSLHWQPQQQKHCQSLPASELCVAPSIRRAAKSWICADTARYSGHIPPGDTVRRHPRCRCASLTSRMPRHFTISFCIFSANARALRVCQAAHSPAFQVMEFGGLVNKWHHSDTARTATLPSLAKRRLQCDKPSTHLSTDMIYPQQKTHLPKQRNIELSKKWCRSKEVGTAQNALWVLGRGRRCACRLLQNPFATQWASDDTSPR